MKKDRKTDFALIVITIYIITSIHHYPIKIDVIYFIL